MKLWILRPHTEQRHIDGPWGGTGVISNGFIIQAEDAASARRIADRNAEGENHWKTCESPWLDDEYTLCEELKVDTDLSPCVVFRDRFSWSCFYANHDKFTKAETLSKELARLITGYCSDEQMLDRFFEKLIQVLSESHSRKRVVIEDLTLKVPSHAKGGELVKAFEELIGKYSGDSES